MIGQIVSWRINEKLFTTFSGKANKGIVSKYGQTDWSTGPGHFLFHQVWSSFFVFCPDLWFYLESDPASDHRTYLVNWFPKNLLGPGLLLHSFTHLIIYHYKTQRSLPPFLGATSHSKTTTFGRWLIYSIPIYCSSTMCQVPVNWR